MARSKTTSDGKANRTNTYKDQTTNSDPTPMTGINAVLAETVPAEIAPEAAPKVMPGTRKLEVVKTEPRKNVVVPSNPVPSNLVSINLEDEIRRRAYELYLQRGPGSGSEAEDWLTAEREIRQRYRQQSA